MTLFLTSILDTRIKDEEGNKIPIAIKNTNDILTNIKKHLKKANRFVSVANNPYNIEENDIRAEQLFESIELTFGKEKFKEKILLDSRNMKNANEILSGADLVVLQGGKCLCQNKFFEKIKLKNILKNFEGVVIGISAGTMNMCKTVNNFPEELADLDEPRWFEGLGFYDEIIIPHFDGETQSYQMECEDFDIAKDYILPSSQGKEFVAMPNGSYIMIDNSGNIESHGNIYKISDGKVELIETADLGKNAQNG